MTETPTPSVAGAVAEQLALWGARQIFAVAGGGEAHLWAAACQQVQLNYVEARSALGAALMTSAHAKLTGRLSICLGTTPFGTASLLTGLLDAQTDGAPVLALGVWDGELGPAGQRGPFLLNPPLRDAATGYARVVRGPDEVAELLALAAKTAEEEHTVAYLSLASEMLQAPATRRPIGPSGHLVLDRWPAPVQRVVEAANALNRAQRPVLVAGWGARSSRDALVRLAEHLDAPVATTCRAKGLIPANHPLAVGVLGEDCPSLADSLVRAADAVVVIGSTLTDRLSAVQARADEGAWIIQLDRESRWIGRTIRVAVPLVGDPYLTLAELARQVPSCQRPAYRQEIDQRKQDWLVRLDQAASSGAVPIGPARVVRELSQICPDDAIVAVDGRTALPVYCAQFFSRNQFTLSSGYLDARGFALPAANAAALARPTQLSIALCDVESFTPTMGELLTAVQHRLPVKVFLLDDRGSPDATGADFAGFARACGAMGLRVEQPAELRPAIEKAIAAGVPAVVQLVVGAASQNRSRKD
jgi:pyruvate oxidase